MAMKRYGLFLADVGMQGQITFGSDVTENPSVVQQLSSIAGITWSNFEAVDESAFVLSQSSNAVNPNNPYQAPANYALLTITDAANANNSVRIPVAIQPVTIGTPDPVVTVQAGTQPFKLPYWVNGTSNQSVTWSITPSEGAGTIADDGTYTPPSSVNGVLQAEVTATSSADPTASTSVQLNLIPAGPIRIDSGSSTGGQDESGNLWLPDLGFETGGYADVNDSYPVNAWGNVPDASVFQTYKYTWGDDIVYKFHVPNGNYRVGLMLGIGGVTGKYYTGTWDNGLVWGGLNLEAQGQTANRNWNLGIPANFQGRTPETVFIPAKVTDTTLTIAIRATTGPTGHSAPIINGLMVTPDASSPHFAIDNQQIRLVTPGNSLQLYPVDWYTGSTDVNWSILQGPGTLTQSGLYVAPLNITVPQWVIVRVHGVQSNAIGTLTLMVPTPGSNVTLPN
ncbi:MAG: hypothetical protein JO061_20000 [Acidobacteriaceae bacterium]|nr:hypothetical protein [Acidobacteriaceae bacterium]